MYKGKIFVCGRQSEEIDIPIKTNGNTENEKCFLKKRRKKKNGGEPVSKRITG